MVVRYTKEEGDTIYYKKQFGLRDSYNVGDKIEVIANDDFFEITINKFQQYLVMLNVIPL